MIAMTALSPKARALVQAGRDAFRPTTADRERVETVLRARLGSGALPPDPGVTQLARTAGFQAAARVAIGACVVGGVAFLALRPSASTPAPQADSSMQAPRAPAAPSHVASTPSTDTPAPAPEPATVAPAHAPSSKARAPRAAHEQDRLAQEVALLSRATSELRADHAREALKLLDEHQRRFPSGALREERQAAKAQALCLLHRVSEGRAELAHLAQQSPAAARAEQVCDSVTAVSDPQ